MSPKKNHQILGLVCAALLGAAAPALGQFTISGTLTGNAAAVDSVEIRLFTATGVPIGIPLTLSDPAGQYAVTGLPNGDYVLQFRPPTATSLVAEERPATVAGANTTLNVSLAAGHILSGFVRDVQGTGIASIDLQAYDRDTGLLALTPGDDTDANGFYDVVLPAGEYDLEWRAVGVGAQPWIPFEERLQIDAATTYDVTLLLGMFVSGTVTDQGGFPLVSVNLDFIDATTGVKALTPGDNTLADGTYTAHVPLGTYNVVAKALPVTHLRPGLLTGVVVGGDVTGVDFVLEPGFVLSGTVSGPGGPLEDVDLDITDVATGADMLAPFDVTDPAGQYAIVLPSGTYDVSLSPAAGVLVASKIVTGVTVAGDTPLNVTLTAGVVFSGVVTGAGLPLPGADIDLKDPVTGLSLPLQGDGTDLTGAFSTVVAPGTYLLEVEPPNASNLVAQRLAGFTIAGTTNQDFALVSGAVVTGTVTTAQGLPLPDVNVDALRVLDGTEIFTPGDHSGVNGQFRLVVPTDAYDFRFKLGVSYAVPDSVFITGVAIAGDQVVNAVFGGVSSVDDTPPVRRDLGLAAAPNPFNPVTRISFDLGRNGPVRLEIHALDGRRVRVLTAGEFGSGHHVVPWNGRDDEGRELPSGVYLVSVLAPGGAATAKVALVK